MKLDRLQEYFTVFCVTTAGVLAGVYCGQLAAQGETKRLGYVAAGIAVMLICLWMKTRIWMLIPFAWDLKAKSYLLPLPFAVRDVFILLCFGIFLIYTALKLIRKKPKHDVLDMIMWLNLIYLLIVYIRNPVGVSSLGNDLVGGRPYFLTIIAVLGYWVLSRVTLTIKQARLLPVLVVISTTIVSFLSLVAFKVPATIPVLSHIYSGIETGNFDETEGDFQEASNPAADPESVSDRIAGLLDFGLVAIALLCAFYPPASLINPLLFRRFLLFTLAWISILYSGHRSGIMFAFSFVVIASYFRSGLLELFKVGAFFVPILLIVVMGNGTLFELPLVAQRALSFLPGKWSHAAVENAQASNEWRIEMWKRAWGSNKYIKNKLLGDGFGTSQKEQESLQGMVERGQVQEAGMEGQLIIGGFHSGPLSTIRFVGFVGLVPFYIWMIYLAFYSVKLIRGAEGTPFYAPAIFFGVPMVIEPFYFTFVFGAYEGALPQIILNGAVLKLIYESLQAYKASQEKPEPGDMPRARRGMHDFVPAHA